MITWTSVNNGLPKVDENIEDKCVLISELVIVFTDAKLFFHGYYCYILKEWTIISQHHHKVTHWSYVNHPAS